MSRPSNKPLYENYIVLAPDGKEIFRCNDKKLRWYLDRNLADIVSENPKTIQLRFQPNGMGHAGDPFYLQDRVNRCVCCGATEDLSKHHVVPHCYRRYLSVHLKESNYYDILPLCITCHSRYEIDASEKKQELAKLYNAPICGINNKFYDQYRKLARALIEYGRVIPQWRRQEMLEHISRSCGKPVQELTLEVLKTLAIPRDIRREHEITGFKSHGELVVSALQDYQRFAEEWRQHFLDTMKPNFLPPHWNVTRSILGRVSENAGDK